MDACLGGFVLPFARQLGWPVPAFDFAVPGVSSMSVDTHKFGMAHKARAPSLHVYRFTNLINLAWRTRRALRRCVFIKSIKFIKFINLAWRIRRALCRCVFIRKQKDVQQAS